MRAIRTVTVTVGDNERNWSLNEPTEDAVLDLLRDKLESLGVEEAGVISVGTKLLVRERELHNE
jgi:hypothetical protein